MTHRQAASQLVTNPQRHPLEQPPLLLGSAASAQLPLPAMPGRPVLVDSGWLPAHLRKPSISLKLTVTSWVLAKHARY